MSGLTRERRLICRDMSDASETAFRGLARELRAAGRSEKTTAAYHSACLSLEDWLRVSGRPADILAATRADVEGWLIALQDGGGWTPRDDGLAQLGRPLAKDSVVSYFGSARRFFNWAAAEGLIDQSPMAAMKAPPASGKPLPIPDVDLVRAMIAGTRPGQRGRSFFELRDELIIRLFCETGGPRCSEVALLPVDGLDLRRDEVTICGKGGKWRKIALSARTASAAQRYLRVRQGHRAAGELPYVFLGLKGQLSPDGVYKVVRKRAQAAGGEIHPHQLRHFSADLAKSDEMSDGDMMTLFGWTTTRMVDRYGKARAEARALEASRRHAIGDRL